MKSKTRVVVIHVTALGLSLMVTGASAAAQSTPKSSSRGFARVDTNAPATFPHRIWAACDFEGRTPDYGWFGPAETNSIPRYPGNRTALATDASGRPYKNVSAVMTGINPVPGPRMGRENGLFLRYFVTGGTEATFQHFSLSSEDNWHIRASGLTTGRWSQATLNFTRNARRNDGSTNSFGDGERMDDFKLFAGRPAESNHYQLFIDDVIFFANDPALPPEPEPFPNRVIFLAAFDTGSKETYWPGDFELTEQPPAGTWWRAAGCVSRKDGRGRFIRLQIEPPRPVGTHTKLRFRYHLTRTSEMTVQIFDATVQDNRHINLRNLRQGVWAALYVDLGRDSRRNDGTVNSPFAAGNLVDDLFFLLPADAGDGARLFVDEVVLFDAGPPVTR